MNTQAFNESIGRRQAEYELSRALRIARETENSFGGQIGVLRERIMQTSDELQRSLEDRSIIQSKLQNAQHQVVQLGDQLRTVEDSKAALERQKSFDSRNERAKIELESEIRQLRHQLESAQESERSLQENTKRTAGRSDQTRREIMELERELRVLKSENSALQTKLAGGNRPTTTITTFKAAPSSSGTPAAAIIPNIPAIKVPVLKQQAVPLPLEIADDSPIVRRGKRNSSVKSVEDSESVAPPIPAAVPAVPSKSSPVKKIKITENDSNGLNSLLDGIGRKKIKLPERFSKVIGNPNGSGISAFSSLAVPSTPGQSEIPRSTPLGKSMDPSVMESIMSSFTVKIPTIKK